MYVDHRVRACAEDGLDERVVGGEEGRVEGLAAGVGGGADEVLPAHREAESGAGEA